MPDLSDVEVALTAATLAALYPSGIDQPSSVGYPVRVFRGEPITATLERDIVANVANVGVFSVADSTRVTTRWLPASLTTAGAPTLMAETEGLTVGYSGLGGIGQVAGIIVDEQAFVYRATGADTPALVAAMLAAAIGKVRPCLLSGATLTIPGAYRVIGRVVADGSSNSELSRQEQSFCIANWCPNPQVRDIVSGTVQVALCAIPFLSITGETSGRLRYRSTSSFDTYQAFQLYRRNLVFDIEYGTTVTTACPTMLFGDVIWAGATVFA